MKFPALPMKLKIVFIAPMNLCKKKVSGKNLEIKTLEKTSKFSQVLGKNVAGNKVLCFGFLGLFSHRYLV